MTPATDLIPLARLAELSQFTAEALRRWPDTPPPRLGDALVGSIPHDPGDSHERALRRFRQMQGVRILWRDVAGRATFAETCRELSRLADICIEYALEIAEEEIRRQHGELLDTGGRPMRLCVLALGKLGGSELNFNSDVDLMFVYRGAGRATGRRALDAREYLAQVARVLIDLLDRVTDHGRAFVVDTRLKPFGSAGTLVWSAGATEQYYLAEGRTWERYALIKARPAAGDLATGETLLARLQPFIYRRYLDYGIFDSLRQMQAQIEQEARAHDMENDIKCGPGGIRELEFVVQSLQLLRGGREPRLRATGYLPALDAIAELRLLPDEAVHTLRAHYAHLRTLENRLQAASGRQTHRLPVDQHQRRQLAALMHTDWPALQGHTRQMRAQVRAVFQAHLGEPATATDYPLVWPLPAEDALADALQQAGVDTPREQAGRLRQWEARIARQPLSTEGRRRLDALMPELLARLLRGRRPGEALDDVLALIGAVARRSAYLALLREQPDVLTRLIDVFARSHRIANWIIQAPQLLDDLIDPIHGHDLPTLPGLDPDQPEDALLRLAHHRRAGFLRVALGEIGGALDVADAQSRLSELAAQVVEAVLRLAGRGRPVGIIAYGNLGAGEMHYSSDLDLVFLFMPGTDSPLREVQRLISFLEAPGPGGKLYEIDTRLRPNGRAGMLVSGMDSFRDYQLNQAWTWEHQALIRARWIAGDPAVRQAFDAVRTEVLARPRDPVEITGALADMRCRQQQERGEVPAKRQITDIQFIVELGTLLNAHRQPSLLDQPAGITRLISGLRGSGWLQPAEAEHLLQTVTAVTALRHHHYLLRRPPELPEPDPAITRIWQRVSAAAPAA